MQNNENIALNFRKIANIYRENATPHKSKPKVWNYKCRQPQCSYLMPFSPNNEGMIHSLTLMDPNTVSKQTNCKYPGNKTKIYPNSCAPAEVIGGACMSGPTITDVVERENALYFQPCSYYYPEMNLFPVTF